tara:strand:+ start:663 stop:1301 length:639 start_codon:yes stop_codon:yes gene_type:complete
MVKVFVGNGQILNINHTIANVNFDAEDQFINRNLSNDVIINIDKNYLNSKLGTLSNNLWSNTTINFDLSEIKGLINSETDILSLGTISKVNENYKNYVQNTFFRPETLYADEDWINNFDTNFDKNNFLNLVQEAKNGYFALNNVNSLFELWRNSSYNTNNYQISDGFTEDHYLYFPSGISLEYSNSFTDNTSNTLLGSVTYTNNYNMVFKII